MDRPAESSAAGGGAGAGPGDRADAAPGGMLALVYDELRALAQGMLRSQRAGHTLQPTALVNEAYVKLLSRTALRADNRLEFLSLAARVMRQVLVDHARERAALKRGGSGSGTGGRITLSDAELADSRLSDPADAAAASLDAIALDEALSALALLDERKARIVEMRVFAGMSLDEAADALGVARSTAALDWRFARAWLIGRLRSHAQPGVGEGPGAGP
ncbi:MAG: ECF-type sigma factor [Phycisphaerales bacterium]